MTKSLQTPIARCEPQQTINPRSHLTPYINPQTSPCYDPHASDWSTSSAWSSPSVPSTPPLTQKPHLSELWTSSCSCISEPHAFFKEGFDLGTEGRPLDLQLIHGMRLLCVYTCLSCACATSRLNIFKYGHVHMYQAADNYAGRALGNNKSGPTQMTLRLVIH